MAITWLQNKTKYFQTRRCWCVLAVGFNLVSMTWICLFWEFMRIESLHVFCLSKQMNTLYMYMAMFALLNCLAGRDARWRILCRPIISSGQNLMIVWRNYAIDMFKGFSIVSQYFNFIILSTNRVIWTHSVLRAMFLFSHFVLVSDKCHYNQWTEFIMIGFCHLFI